MSVPEFHAPRSWTNPADFPTHQNNEAQNRADLQEFPTLLENYLNNTIVPALNSILSGNAGSGGESGDMSGYLPIAGGTMTGPLRLARLPLFDSEAASKEYVDSAAQSVMTNGTDMSAISQRVDEIELLVQSNSDEIGRLGRVTVRTDEVTLQLLNTLGKESLIQLLQESIKLQISSIVQGDSVAAGITLKVFGEDASYGQILLNGNVDISGQLSADALYAPYGEIANLSVDHLETSRKIVKYLKGDASDNNFVRAFGETCEWVVGKTSGGTEQARNPNGALLYWPMDVSGLPLGSDGYPLHNGERVFTVTQQTSYPVTVYHYQESIKRCIRFELNSQSGIYEVHDAFGAGNASGLNIAHIVKTANEWDFLYTTSAGKVIGLHMHNNGYVDVDGLRKTTGLDFSHFHEGYFTETVEGASQPKEYRVEFDNGIPTSITDEGGNTLQITW